MRTTSLARPLLATIGLLLLAAFFLAAEHRARLFGVLPYLLLLACPLPHLLGHRGHDGDGAQGRHDRQNTTGYPPERDARTGHVAGREAPPET